MANQKYTSIEEMLRGISEDKQFADDFDRHVGKRRLVKHLFALRSVEGLSQKDIAERIGCSQSRISKLENGTDDDLRLADLAAHLGALDLDLCLVFGQKDWRKSTNTSQSVLDRRTQRRAARNDCLGGATSSVRPDDGSPSRRDPAAARTRTTGRTSPVRIIRCFPTAADNGLGSTKAGPVDPGDGCTLALLCNAFLASKENRVASGELPF